MPKASSELSTDTVKPWPSGGIRRLFFLNFGSSLRLQSTMIRTYRYRVKDRNHAKWLISRARAVNFVWDWCNDAQKHAIRHNQKWPSGFDLNTLSSGCGQELSLYSQTIQAVCEKFAAFRRTSKRAASGIGARKPMVGFHLKPWALGFRMAASSTASVS